MTTLDWVVYAQGLPDGWRLVGRYPSMDYADRQTHFWHNRTLAPMPMDRQVPAHLPTLNAVYETIGAIRKEKALP